MARRYSSASQCACCVLLIVVLVWWLWSCAQRSPVRENMSGGGFLVTSGLALNNRATYCLPDNGSSFSGGCFVPHRVVF